VRRVQPQHPRALAAVTLHVAGRARRGPINRRGPVRAQHAHLAHGDTVILHCHWLPFLRNLYRLSFSAKNDSAAPGYAHQAEAVANTLARRLLSGRAREPADRHSVLGARRRVPRALGPDQLLAVHPAARGARHAVCRAAGVHDHGRPAVDRDRDPAQRQGVVPVELDVDLGFGRIIDLCYHPSTSHQKSSDIWCHYF
jgi:hypothetical protein